ncbi:MAG TPA: hypothetical protein VGJ95_00680 [Pseudonocardiaceae bacterium]
MTNDKAVVADGVTLVDAHTLLDESHPLVMKHSQAFRPVAPAADEGEARSSAAFADPSLQVAPKPVKATTKPVVETPAVVKSK